MTDAESFEAFVRRHQGMVFAVAVRLLGSRTEAEDVAQTVFLRAFERFATIADSDAAAAWLRTVTRNTCLNHLTRYRSRWRLFSELEHPGPDGEDNFAAALPAALPADAAGPNAERLVSLERALANLPAHQRVPLVLFHYEEMGYQEIADLLGISLGKLKTDIRRGREALKRVLMDQK